MERALVPEVSLVKAWKADKSGNLVFRRTARNFNPAVAMAGKITVVEVEEIVETGTLRPGRRAPAGHLRAPHRAQRHPREAHREAHDHRARARKRRSLTMAWTHDQMAARAAQELAGRLLRQPRHRPADAGGQLRRPEHRGLAAKRERHARHRPVPDRGRGRRRPHQRRQADRDDDPRLVSIFGSPRQLRDDPRRQDQPVDPGRDAGQREGRPGQLDDPRQDGQGHGRRDGPGRPA